jgi:anti-anti-sigma regulatory factor
MDFNVAFENLEKKFISGNSIPVVRSVITHEEWEAIKKELEECRKQGKPHLIIDFNGFNYSSYSVMDKS